jgi:hypothetical protein
MTNSSATQSPEGNWYWSLIKPQQLRGPGWMSIAADRCRGAAERKVGGDTGIERSAYSSVQEVAEGRQIARMMTAAWDVEVKGDVVLKGAGPDLPAWQSPIWLTRLAHALGISLNGLRNLTTAYCKEFSATYAARDSQPVARVVRVGISFHHDRTLENPLPVVPERCAERRPSLRGEFLYAV